MIFTKINILWLSIFIRIFNTISCDDSGEEFLNAVISRLKQQKFIDDYGSPFENIFGQMRRSVDDYKVDSMDTLENAVDQQNNGINTQTENLQQNNQVSGLYTLANLKQPWDSYHQFNENPYNVDGVQATPHEPNLSVQNLEAYAAGLNNLGAVNADPLQFNFASAAINDQFQAQNDQFQVQNNQLQAQSNQFQIPNSQFQAPNNQFQAQNNGNDIAQNNEALLPTHYFYNPADNSIDDNLLDEAVNAMKTPYDQLGQESDKKYIVEPLFVAMAGFVGIAMIFMSAVLFLPKLVTPHPTVNGLRAPQELAALTKLAVEAMDGNDCTERIACEVGRAMRSMQVGSQPIKMIEVILPASMAKQLAQIRKAVATEQACKLIQCKKMATPQLKVNKKATAELKNNTNVQNKKNDKPEAKKP